MKIKKKKNYVSKQFCEEKHVNFLAMGEGQKHVFISDFNRFMYDHALQIMLFTILLVV